ncbi:hypothetical protein BH09VER1_BH09VER1_06010 [soil metagenome]
MLRSLFCSLALSVALASTLPAMTAAVEHPGSVPILLGLDKVRTELKLDSLQRAVLDSIRSEYKSSARKLVPAAGATQDQRAAAEKSLLLLNDRYNKRALSVLNDRQRERFAEIELQVLGASAVYVPSVQGKLSLTAKQKQQIEAIRLAGLSYVGKINHQFEDGKIGYYDRMKLLHDRRMSLGVSLMKILTPEQRAALLTLEGKIFSFQV